MRNGKIMVVFIVAILSLMACEKDDICVDGNSPLLVIRFYDVEDTLAVKAVSGLNVQGLLENLPQGVIPNASLDSIALPLRIGEVDTSFLLGQNLTPNNEETVNNDILTFNYETREVFISRACGFIANYDNLNNQLTPDFDNWIKRVEIIEPTVANSLVAHVKIFH